MKILKRRSYVGILSACALAMVSTACSPDVGGASNSGSDEASAGATTVRFALATEDINVGYPFATLPFATGCYERMGLDVELIPAKDGATVTQLLLSGRADLGLMNPDAGALMATANGDASVVSVYPVSRKISYKVLVRPGSDITDTSDLEGRRIGQLAVGAGSVIFSDFLYASAGFSQSDVEHVIVGYGAPAMDALEGGDIDAYVTFKSMIPRLEAQGYEFEVLPDPPFVYDQYGFNVYVAEESLDEQATAIEGVGRCFAESTVFAQANPEAAVHAFWETYPDRAPGSGDNESEIFDRDVAIVRSQLEEMLADQLPPEFDWGSQEEHVWASTVEYFEVGTGSTISVDPRTLYNDSFVDAFNDFDRQKVIDTAEGWDG